MKALCFALMLSQNAQESAAPPSHIQDLLKKRLLYQLKQRNPDTNFYFDEASCNVVGNYDFVQDHLQITANDRSVQQDFPYADLLEGESLELSGLQKLIQTKENVILAMEQQNTTGTSAAGSSTFIKWLPWVAGALGVGVGGFLLYSSLHRPKHDDTSPPAEVPNVRRYQ